MEDPATTNSDDAKMRWMPWWDEAAMERSIAHFRKSGDFSGCLDLVATGEEKVSIQLLQNALRSAKSRDERDAFEDIAHQFINGGRGGEVPVEFIRKVERRVERAYGVYAKEVVDIGRLARGIYNACDEPPPVNSVVAAVGIEAQRSDVRTISVDAKDLGKMTNTFLFHCDECGGATGGRGYIICPDCMDKALDILRKDKHYSGVEDQSELKSLAGLLITERPKNFGCMGCEGKPVVFCHCAIQISVPHEVRDGEIIIGQHAKDGKELFCCVRLKEGLENG